MNAYSLLRLCGLLIVLLTNAGCVHSPVNQDKPITEKTSSLLSDVWWKGLHDPLADQFIHMLLEKNLSLQQAVTRIEQARSLVLYQSGHFYPEGTLNATFSRGQAQAGVRAPFTELKTGMNITWEADLFGRLKAQEKSALAGMDYQTALYDDMRRVLINDLMRSLIAWRMAQENLKIIDQLLATQDQQISFFQQQVTAGLTDGIILERAKAHRLNTETQRPIVLESSNRSKRQIEMLLGNPPESLDKLFLDTAFLSLALPNTQTDQDIQVKALQKRPDIRAATTLVKQSKADQLIAEANLYPTLSLTAFLGIQSISDTVPHAQNPLWQMGGGIIAPLLNRTKLLALLAGQEAKTQEVTLDYADKLNRAVHEVFMSVHSYHHAQQTLRLAIAEQTARERTVSLATERLQRGLTDIIDLTTAQTEATSATLSTLAHKHNALNAWLDIQKAVGR